MSERQPLSRDPQDLEHTGTMDDLLAEVAMTHPMAYTPAPEESDEEATFDHQILAGLVSP
jgi:hypothetical protein